MATKGIPCFKPSGGGLTIDLKNIKIAEAISWGAYKGKLKKQYKNVAGTEIKDGREVFKHIDINQYAGQPESETYKLLQTFGISEEDLQELSTAWNENDLEKFQIIFDADQSTLEENWIYWVDIIHDIMTELDEIKIIGTPVEYNTTIYPIEDRNPIYTDDWNINHLTADTTHAVIPFGSDYTETSDLKIAKNDRLMNVFTVQLFSNSIDVSENFTEQFKKTILAIILMENDNSFIRTSSNFTRVESSGWEAISQTETFNTTLNKTHIDTLYTNYTKDDPNEDDIKFRISGQMVYAIENYEFEYFPYYWGNIWYGRDHMGVEDLFEMSDGLFVQVDRTWNAYLQKWYGGSNRMTYEGLRKSTHKNFGYYVSEFMEVYAKVDQGGFLKRFFMGLIKAFLSLIDAFVNLLFKIPILKQLIEILVGFIGKLFGLTFSQSIGIMKSLIKTILIAVAIYFAPMLAGELAGAWGGVLSNLMAGTMSGLQMIPHLISAGVNIYTSAQSGIQKGTQEDIKAEKQKLANENPEIATTEAFMGTLGTTKQHEATDELMFNLMFNPLELINMGELPPTLGEKEQG